jgi:hypothetical protein
MFIAEKIYPLNLQMLRLEASFHNRDIAVVEPYQNDQGSIREYLDHLFCCPGERCLPGSAHACKRVLREAGNKHDWFDRQRTAGCQVQELVWILIEHDPPNTDSVYFKGLLEQRSAGSVSADRQDKNARRVIL